VYGNAIYEITSSVCRAGIHNGHLNNDGGYFRIKIAHGEALYDSTE